MSARDVQAVAALVQRPRQRSFAARMIAGAAPRLEWRPNLDGATRTIHEACEIATSWGIVIPSYVQFSVDEYDYLDENTTAKTTTFNKNDRPTNRDVRDRHHYWISGNEGLPRAASAAVVEVPGLYELPAEIPDEMLAYARRYDPSRPRLGDVPAPAEDQVRAAESSL